MHPTMVPRTHPLADVNGALNAIAVHGDALGASMYVGAGAGMMPTATAVVADLMDVARNRLHGCRGRVAPLGYPVRQQTAGADGGASTPCAASTTCASWWSTGPACSAALAGILGQHEISIASVIQREREHGRVVPVVIRTHDVSETRPCAAPSAPSTG